MTRDDPRFTSDGRAVGFADLTDESHESVPNQARFPGTARNRPGKAWRRTCPDLWRNSPGFPCGVAMDFRLSSTGMEPGNTASETVCRKMGLVQKAPSLLSV